jgi:gliding motility associated protien GldN
MKNLIISIIYICSFKNILAQTVPAEVRGPYDANVVSQRKPVPWHRIIEADASYHWRVERIIDTRIKQNSPLQWPKSPLHALIKRGLEENKLVAYKNDSLRRVADLEYIFLKLNHQEQIQVQNSAEEVYSYVDSTVNVEYNWEDFKRFKIMEDWIYDKKEGRMYCRIVYIAPMYQPYAGGAPVPEQPAFYLKYYDPANLDTKCFRNVAVNSLVFNPQNVAHRLTFDDFFEMRMFNSYLIKESNLFDNRFKDYDELKDDPIATMLESEKASEKLFKQEMDSWEH